MSTTRSGDVAHTLDGKTLLICVGAPKCATSWVHDYLGGFPEVATSPLKEVNFFNARFPANALGDVDALALSRLKIFMDHTNEASADLRAQPAFQASIDRVQMIYDDAAYFAHFARLCTPQTTTICDITPGYCVIGAEGFSWMRALCAAHNITLRILFVMRDPITRLWSQLRHLQQMNPENDAEKKWRAALASPPVMARADYQSTVAALDAVFDPREVLYVFYETLLDEAVLRALCDFAGLEYRPGNTGVRRNETQVQKPLPEAARDAFAAALASQYAFCRERFGFAVPAAWTG